MWQIHAIFFVLLRLALLRRLCTVKFVMSAEILIDSVFVRYNMQRAKNRAN